MHISYLGRPFHSLTFELVNKRSPEDFIRLKVLLSFNFLVICRVPVINLSILKSIYEFRCILDISNVSLIFLGILYFKFYAILVYVNIINLK